MPATSKAQQRLFGLAYAIKKGDVKKSDADAKAVEIADSMSLKDLKKFAETDHKGLPDKVKESLLTEGKGYTEASKLIKNLRSKVYPKLNDDELLEFKREMVDHLGGTLDEGITPGNMGGMGGMAFPSNTNGAADGSGDVPAGRGDAEEEYKKKKKKRDAEIKKQKNESMVHTSFDNFVNEEYQANGKYNTVAKVRKKLGPRASEKEVAEFVIANLKDVTGIGPKELTDGRKTDLALDKIADIAAFYKFDDVEWNEIFQDAINNAPYEWEVDYNFEESVDEAKIRDAREDLGYVSFMKEMSDLNNRDLEDAYNDALDVLQDKGMSEKEAVGFLNSPHGKYMAEYVIPGMDFGREAFLDKLDEYYNERMLKKYAKDFKGLA